MSLERHNEPPLARTKSRNQAFFFVMIDGWNLLIGSLVRSVA
jgi:hypothetical protein